MSFNRKAAIAAGAFAAVLAGGLAYMYVAVQKPQGLTGLISSVGFVEVVPPGAYYLPGTILTVERISDGRVRVHPTCLVPAELIERFQIQSATLDGTYAENLARGVDVDVGVLENIFGIKSNDAISSRISLRNVKLRVVATADLIDILQAVLALQPNCTKAIEHNIMQGATVCQAESVLQADAIITLIQSDKVSLDEKNQAIADLTASQHLELLQGSESKTKGEGLYFGVRIAELGLTLNTDGEAPAVQHCRMM